jgi:heme oxygenase
LSSRMRDAASYRSLLELFLGFFRPLEDAVIGVPDIMAVVPDLQSRQRANLLQKDLASLGLSPRTIRNLPDCGELPRTENLSQAVGCLYVLEGSTLGGQIVTRQIQESAATSSMPCSFFGSHGENVGSMWKKFGMAAEKYAAQNPNETEAICVSARHTFRCLESWAAVFDALNSTRH